MLQSSELCEASHEPLIPVRFAMARTETAHLIRRERCKLDQPGDIVCHGNPLVREEQERRSADALCGPEVCHLPIKRDEGVVIEDD